MAISDVLNKLRSGLSSVATGLKNSPASPWSITEKIRSSQPVQDTQRLVGALNIPQNISSFFKGERDLGSELRSLKNDPDIGRGFQTIGYGIQNVGSDVNKGIRSFAENFPGKNTLGKKVASGIGSFFGEGIIGGYGRSLTSYGEKGHDKFFSDIKNIGSQFDKGFLEGVGSQEFEDATNLLDVAPFGIVLGGVVDASKGLRSLKYSDDVIKGAKSVDEAVDTIAPALRSGASKLDKLKNSFKGLKETPVGKMSVRTLQASKNFFKKAGDDGKKIYDLLEGAATEGDIAAGKAVNAMKNALKKLDPDEAASLADVIEGLAKPVSDNQAEAVKVWKELAEDVANTAKALNIKVKDVDGNVREFMEAANFFPRYVDDETFKMLEKSGNLPEFLKRKATRRYGHLEFGRMPDVDEIDYKRTPEVLLDYLESAYKRLSDAAHFGQDDSVIYELAKKLPDADEGVRILDRILQKEVVDPTARAVSESVRKFQTVTKLDPVSSIVNLGQNISTAIYTNPKVTTKAIIKKIFKGAEADELALEAGEILQGAMKEYYSSISGASKDGFTAKYIRKIGFGGSEQLNRSVAVNAGAYHAKDLFRKLVKKPDDAFIREALSELTLDPDKLLKTGLTRDDMIRAGKRVSQKTQFSTGAKDLPYFWSSPSGKVMTQFKQFAYKQTEFITSQMARSVSQAKKGNFKPLINTLTTAGIGGGLLGEVINDAKAVLRGKGFDSRDDEEPLERYLNNVFAVVSLGLLSDVGTLATGKYGTRGTIGVMGGPTVSDAIEFTEDIQQAGKGNFTPALRSATKRIPAIGRPLDKAIFGNSSSSKKRIYK